LFSHLGTPPLSSEAKLTIKVNDINEYCPKLVNMSSQPYIFIFRQDFSKTNSSQMFDYRLSAFDKDISDQSNITFRLLPSIYSSLFHLDLNGLLILKELRIIIPSIIELQYSLTDHFSPNSCTTQDKLIILIGETLNDRNYLINQYEKQLSPFEYHRLTTQKLQNYKRRKPEIIFIFVLFTFSIFIVVIGIFTLLFVLCCQKRRKRRQSITTKSSSLINPSLLLADHNKQQRSPHSFITDSSRKSSQTSTFI
jgi:hypothetical protein